LQRGAAKYPFSNVHPRLHAAAQAAAYYTT
jgi:hypothetical protein